ncbi:glycosyltransferase family 2 protein [Rhodoplanes sp. Z2-YC6860]|uniref:glycosyltransferase family 2 protein n=1 Tax=Rhodoplanes sp. Z2-YC6860 TaxID=674703 RepID=UPI00078D3ABE|nr:glycosyltransferase [Rhodoplanes sp. Z2-YC6860]AMN43742.1 family 2 glycosyl transferase [Rhodoplanes sp. Z2-YC6860]
MMPPDTNDTWQSGLVSVIIPCYNSVRFVEATLESVFAQTFPRVEVIVVDDGSTDGSTELIRSLGNQVRAEFGPNRGVSAARNRGTALARGEFIQYLDADDLLVPDAIERRVTALQTTNADVAYSDWKKLVEIAPGTFESGEQVTRRIEDLDVDSAIAHLKFWAPLAALTYRRTIVDRIGGWKEWLPIVQDARFLQDAGLLGGSFVHVPGAGAVYRVPLGGSLSRRSEAAFVADVYRNGCDLQSFVERQGVMSARMQCHIASIYGYSARTLFFYDHEAFRDCIRRLYALEPGFQLTWPKVASVASSVVGFQIAGILLLALAQIASVCRSIRSR